MKRPEKIQLQPYFTQDKDDVWRDISWAEHEFIVPTPSGSQKISAKFPHFWSSLACSIVVSRYFAKANVGKSGVETSLKDLINRVLLFLKAQPETKKLKGDWLDDVAYLILHQFGSFNSPVWFNCGLYHAYKIAADGQNFKYNPKTKKTEMVENVYEFPQTSACFIQSIEDNLISIYELLKNEAKVFKYGSGTGTNFSNLRSRHESLAQGGESSGLMSFLEIFDKSAGAIKSGGAIRRAAKMVCVDIDHPEVEDFIQWKSKEEEKAKALVKLGYAGGMTGEAYKSVSGQNSNNSIQVNDDFMKCLVADGEWALKARTSGKEIKKVKARELWESIAKAAWECGDPGVQFSSTINRWNTCAQTEPINASNPCSEFMFLDNTACNLSSLNLLKFLNEEQQFEINRYKAAAKRFLISQELLINGSSFPTEKIASNSFQYRPLGLGFTNLGALLMVMGVPYDSETAVAWAGFLAALLTGESYKTSALLAKDFGAFKKYSVNKKSMLKVIGLHAQHLKSINWDSLPENAREETLRVWSEVEKLGKRYGFRNAQVTAIAPTGTIGLMMDCDTLGIEPEFALIKRKHLIEGRSVVMVNANLPRALRNLNYTDVQIEEIIMHLRSEESLSLESAPHLSKEHLKIFDCAHPTGRGTRFLHYQAHINIMKAVQPFISGSISKTVNLPASISVKEIEEIYFQAWKLGLKNISVYRHSSKQSQPLTT